MTVASERSFSRAAMKLSRTQPAVSLALQRLESELGEKLLDRFARGCGADRRGAHGAGICPAVSESESEMLNSIAELRDHAAGRLVIGANESTEALSAAAHREVSAAVSACEGAGAAEFFEPDSG